jgi:PGF-CTERM protein
MVVFMNKQTLILSLFLTITIVILVGTPESLASSQYVANLTAVYGNGSCGTCHVIASGSGMRNSNRTFPLNSYGTLFQNQPDHATDPSAALLAIGQPPPAIATPGDPPTDTAVTAAGTPAAPGFEIVLSLVGLFAMAILARRHNK